MSSSPTTDHEKELHAAISKIFVKWKLPTRQVAISELVQLFGRALQRQAVKMRIKQRTVKRIIDEVIPTCNELNCDVCERRHIEVAKRLAAIAAEQEEKK